MSFQQRLQDVRTGFERPFWVANISEIFERLAYYGAFASLANYLREHYEESVDDCAAAVERMPCHFGALAGLGHCYAHLGKAREAIDAYEKALEVNPHLDCIRQTIEHLRTQI